jgi:hypothetical protein
MQKLPRNFCGGVNFPFAKTIEKLATSFLIGCATT